MKFLWSAPAFNTSRFGTGKIGKGVAIKLWLEHDLLVAGEVAPFDVSRLDPTTINNSQYYYRGS